MNSRVKEFMGVVCSLYLVGILVAVPLFMKDGYWQIGDGKYELFRNLSVLCAGCWLAALLVGVFGEKDEKSRINWTRIKWSWMDSFVLSYGLVNFISFWGSAYREAAWTGYVQWYMGLLSQLLFVWIYFLTSRWFDGNRLVLYAGQAGLAITVLIGLMNRLGIDILGVFQGLPIGGWDYTYLLSTVGNINWLCGYLGVALAFSLGCCFSEKKMVPAVLQLLVCIAAIVLLVIQGSDSGLVIAGVLAAAACWAGGSSHALFCKVMLLGIGSILGIYLMNWGMESRKSLDRLPLDDKGRYVTGWNGWWIVLALLTAVLGIYLYLRKRSRRKEAVIKQYTMDEFDSPETVPEKQEELPGVLRKIMHGIAVFLVLGMSAAGTVLLLRMKEQGYGWGNGRGGLWALALDAFREGSLWQKLAGVGPDCFGYYVYDRLPAEAYIMQSGRWENAVFVNAHNEWLSLLVNTGILGLCSFLGILAAGLIRYGRHLKRNVFLWIGILAVAAYGVNSLVSFQQVLSTPLLFAALGICENRYREEKSFDT